MNHIAEDQRCAEEGDGDDVEMERRWTYVTTIELGTKHCTCARTYVFLLSLAVFDAPRTPARRVLRLVGCRYHPPREGAQRAGLCMANFKTRHQDTYTSHRRLKGYLVGGKVTSFYQFILLASKKKFKCRVFPWQFKV